MIRTVTKWAIFTLIPCIAICAACTKKSDDVTPRKKALTYSFNSEPIALDPAKIADVEAFKTCDLLYENLVQYALNSTEIRPQLATRWDVSADELTWTFYLRTGVIFHNGSPLTAKDVVFSFERQHNPQHPFYNVEGKPQYWHIMGMEQIFKSITALNDTTIQFELNKPCAPFLSNLAMNFAAIVNSAAFVITEKDTVFEPIGTGPFILKEWQPNVRMVFVRNEHYWDEKAALDSVIIKMMPNYAARLNALQNGKVDVMEGILPNDIATIRANPELRIIESPGMNVAYIATNVNHPPFDQKDVRLALNLAINKEAIIDYFYNEQAVVAVNPIPPNMWGYNPKITPHAYDPQRARALLARAGFANGFKTSLWCMSVSRPYMPRPVDIAKAVQADLRNVGIEAELKIFEWAEYLNVTEEGQHDLALIGWLGDNGDPDNFFFPLFSEEATQVPATNICFYKNDQLNQLMLDAQRTSDRTAREKLYLQAQKFIYDEAPWVPLVHTIDVVALQATINGYRIHPTGKFRLNTIWVNE